MSNEAVEMFREPKLKLLRARKHICEFERGLASAIDGGMMAHIVCRNRTTGEYASIFWNAETPLELSAIFGDAIHNMRACLDLLANETLTISNVRPKHVKFPLSDSKQNLETQFRDKMKQAPEHVLQLIRDLKPYRGGNDLLRALHDLDIKDKHEMLIPSVAVQTIHIPALLTKGKGFVALEPDYMKLRMAPFAHGSGDPSLEVIGRAIDATIELLIAPGFPLEGNIATEVLYKQHELVNEILAVFEQRFARKGRNLISTRPLIV